MGSTSSWTTILDTDDDGYVEWGLQVDQKNNDLVELVPATTGGPNLGDIELSTVGSWTGSLSEYARYATATDGSNLGGNVDGFIDMAIPWSEFSSNTGLSFYEPFRVAFATSASDEVINKDFPLYLSGSDSAASAFADPIMATPEPGTTSLALLSVVFLTYMRRRFKSTNRSR